MLREVKVGLLVLAALAVLGAGVFLVGERNNLFARKNRYFVRFETVSGLAAGNPVQLNGVNVGQVESVVLPVDVEEELLTVWITVDRRYAERVRTDSEAKIKTLGLLGDKYIELSSGSPGAPEIADGGEITAAPATDVDKLIATGGDVVENVVAISYSLRNILGRMEAGEGILGELTTDSEAGRVAKESMLDIMGSLRRIAGKIESGEGTLASLINDPALADRMAQTVDRVEAVLAKIDTGEGALPALLNDPETRTRLDQILTGLSDASTELSATVEGLSGGEGLLAKLLTDEAYGEEVSRDLKQLLNNLNKLSGKLEQGDGTLGQLINDPSVYEALNDVIVGIDESKLLRWLIRNRQKAGIKKRYREERRPPAPTPP